MHTPGDNTVAPDKSFAEFFAGIGLVQLGLAGGGWQCGYANDIDSKKFAMYSGMFGASPEYHVEDVWDTQAVIDRWPASAFLATASFPCIDLSLAGHGKGFEGEHSSTYFGFLEVLKSLGDAKPKLVMLENVIGFLNANKGQDFKQATVALAELGYELDAIVLDARWFVPQSRPRLFVFGIHRSITSSLNDAVVFDSEWDQHGLISDDAVTPLRPAKLMAAISQIELPTSWRRLRIPMPSQVDYELVDVIDLDGEQNWWEESQVVKHYEMMERPSKERVDQLIRLSATTAGTAFRRTRRGKARTEVRFDVAGCLRTPKGGSAKQIVVAIIEGQLKMRWMSAREYARLQGVGQFCIKVPENQAMYGFGDAVCVPAIAWIDRHVLSPIYECSANLTVQKLSAIH